MSRLSSLAIPAAILGLAGMAVADSHVSDEVAGAVNIRQSHMSLYGFNLGPLAGMARGRMDYDAEVAGAAAANLAALAAMDQGGYWVEGSSNDDLEESEALAAIWDDPTGFEERMMALQLSSADLAAVAGNGLTELQAGMGPVGQSCGGCHEDYRISDN